MADEPRTYAPPPEGPDYGQDQGPPPDQSPPPSPPPPAGGPTGWEQFYEWYSSHLHPYVSPLLDPIWEPWSQVYHLLVDEDPPEPPNEITGQPEGFDPTERGDGTKYYFPEDELSDLAARLAERNEPPPPPRIRPKPRPQVGGTPVWMQLAMRLMQGLNPITGKPWDINPLTDEPWEESRTFAEIPEGPEDDTPDEPEKTKGPNGKDKGRTEARQPPLPPPPEEEEEDSDIAFRIDGFDPPPAELAWSSEQLEDLMNDCPPLTKDVRRARGLESLETQPVPADLLQKLQADVASNLAKIQDRIEATAARISQPVETKNQLPGLRASLEQSLEAIKGRIGGPSSGWKRGGVIDCRGGACSMRNPELDETLAQLARVDAADGRLRNTQADLRTQLSNRLREEGARLDALSADVHDLGGNPLLAAAGVEPSAADVWTMLCTLRLKLRIARQLENAARVAEGAIVAFESDLSSREETSFLGLGIGNLLFGHQKASRQMAVELTRAVTTSDRAGQLENALGQGADEDALHVLHGTVLSDQNNTFMHESDQRTVQRILEDDKALANWVIASGELAALEAATLGADKLIGLGRRAILNRRALKEAKAAVREAVQRWGWYHRRTSGRIGELQTLKYEIRRGHTVVGRQTKVQTPSQRRMRPEGGSDADWITVARRKGKKEYRVVESKRGGGQLKGGQPRIKRALDTGAEVVEVTGEGALQGTLLTSKNARYVVVRPRRLKFKGFPAKKKK